MKKKNKEPQQSKLCFNEDLSLNPFKTEHEIGLFNKNIIKTPEPESLYEEKYKPQTIKDYIGNKKAIKEFKTFLKQTNVNKLMILHGPPGSGKTCLINILLKDYRIIEFNSGEKTIIFDKIKKSLNNLSVTTTFLDENPRIIVIEDIDKTIGDGVYYTRLLTYISEQTNNCKVIATTTNLKKKYNTPTKVNIIKIESLTFDECLKYCRKIASSEHLSISDKGMRTIALSSKYDFRKILHMFKLLSFITSTNKLKHKDILRVLNFSEQDATFSAYEIVEEAFSGEYPEESENLIDYCYSDQNTIMDLLYSNINMGNMEMEEISKSLDSIAMGDIYHHQMFQNQHWNLKALATFMLEWLRATIPIPGQV